MSQLIVISQNQDEEYNKLRRNDVIGVRFKNPDSDYDKPAIITQSPEPIYFGNTNLHR